MLLTEKIKKSTMIANYKNPLTIILAATRKCVIGLCLVLLMTFVSWNYTANADNFSSSAQETIQELDQKGKSTLDEIAGAGTSNKIEGQVDRATGELQEQAEKAGAELKGTAKQVRGKAKEDIGTVQNKIEEGSEAVEETSENMFDSITSFLGQE